jgi:hypothetical protein
MPSKTLTPSEQALADLEQVQSHLAVLRGEERDLPRRLEAATAVADVAEVLALRARQDRLGPELLAAQVVVVRARMAWLEAQRADPAHAAAKAAAFGELAAAESWLREAEAAVAAGQGAVADLRAREHDWAVQLGACRRELDGLQAQHAGQGPTVRFAWQVAGT